MSNVLREEKEKKSTENVSRPLNSSNNVVVVLVKRVKEESKSDEIKTI